MKKKTLTLCLLIMIVAPLIFLIQGNSLLSNVEAQTKTIVVPDDYPTLNSAIGNATDGDTILVRSGIYEEHSLIVTKSISLIGENTENTIIKNIDPSTPLFGSSIMVGPAAITISAEKITISGFTITSGGMDIIGGGERTQIVGNILEGGIQMQRGTYQTIAKNIINGMVDLMSPYTYFVNNTGNCNLVVQMAGNQGYNNVVFGNTFAGVGAGVVLYETHDNMVANNIFVNCGLGISSDISYHNLIFANTISNGDIGLAVIQGSEEEIFYANNIVNNTFAVAVSGNNTFYDNNFINNKNQVESADLIVGPNPPSSIVWDNGKEGNFWSYYTGVDTNHNGIGDTPYVINADNTDRYPLMTPFENSEAIVNLPEWAMEINTVGFSDKIAFTIATSSFPTTLAIESVASVTVIVAVVLVSLLYFKKRKRHGVG